MSDNTVSLRNSVAASLIKKVLGIYIAVTIVVTCVQLVIEYFHVKHSIMHDISTMEKTFEAGLAEALWTFDARQLQSIISGMNELSAIVGVKNDNDEGAEIGSTGSILSRKEQVLVTPDGERLTSSSHIFTPLKGMFSHSFQINYNDPLTKGISSTGRATIYSASNVVIDRIKYGFFLILINSAIKVALLWFIIFYFVGRIVGKPLAVLTEAARKMNPANPEFFKIKYSPEEKKLLKAEDELGVLTRTFDSMRNAILERIDNLYRLRHIGEELAVSHEISSTFTRIMTTMKEKFAFNKGLLFLADDQDILRMTACCPDAEHNVPEAGSFQPGEGMAGKAAGKHKVVYLSDPSDFPGEADPSEPLLCVPLTDEDTLTGTMNFFGNSGQFELTDENKVFLQAVARLAVINIRNIQMLKMIEENTRLKQEMDLARKIQTTLLPAKVNHQEIDIEAIMIPADEVGGDFYDILYGEGDELWIGIGDVSGHGVTPGLIMMMAQTVHTAITVHFKYTPREVVSIINNVLYKNVRERLGESHFMTFTTLKYLGEGRFEYAGAHLSLVVYRKKDKICERIKTEGVFLNFIEDISHATVNSYLTLDSGDILVLYTDGLTEAKNSKGELLDIGGFMKIVETHAHEDTEMLRDSIVRDVMKWCDSIRADDMSLVVAKRKD